MAGRPPGGTSLPCAPYLSPSSARPVASSQARQALLRERCLATPLAEVTADSATRTEKTRASLARAAAAAAAVAVAAGDEASVRRLLCHCSTPRNISANTK